MSLRSALLGTALVIGSVTTHAHHSITGVYDFGERITLRAVVAGFEFVNPHPFLIVDIAEGTEAPGRWRLEMDNRRELAELGFKADTLAAGDRLTLVVNPARSEPRRGYVRRLERPDDGFTYQHHD